jgi:hypothetical protein
MLCPLTQADRYQSRADILTPAHVEGLALGSA